MPRLSVPSRVLSRALRVRAMRSAAWVALVCAPSLAAAEEPAPPKPNEPREAHRAVYVTGELGVTRPMLGALSDDLGFDRSAASGVLYGLGAGVRLRDLRLGMRWRVQDTTEFALWSLGATAGYVLSARPLTPILTAHLAYVFDQEVQAGAIRSALPIGNVLPPNVDLRGALVGVDAEASYLFGKLVRLGLFIGVDALYLHRAKAAPAQSLFGPTPELAGNPLYAGSGDGFGLGIQTGIRGSFDIGLD